MPLEIGAWLEGLGLAEYEPAFREHQITADVIGDLSDDDLKAIGITTLGARKRLLRAIADLPLGAQDVSPRPAVLRQAHLPVARRHLTVMFVDMVGSTPLSVQLDPEDLGTVISRFYAAVNAQVTAFGGFTARSFGDGILAYFGYPQTHEDDAERAARSALLTIKAVEALTGPDNVGLTARIGIATGWVVLGDLAGTAQHEVVGEAPNLAARLQGIARPGSVVVSNQTARLLGNAFELVDLGGQALKGFTTDQRAWLVSSVRATPRFDARAERGLTELVGRDADLGVLFDRWRRVHAGEGQVVLVTGEPGIGKSRTIYSFQESLRSTQYKSLLWQCSSFHVSSALHPVVGELAAAAGFANDDSTDARRTKLRQLHSVQHVDDIEIFVRLLAELLSVTGITVVGLPPEEKKVRLFGGLVDRLRSLARSDPTLLIVEDAHWIDPTTAELLDRVIETISTLPIMVVVTARPEYPPSKTWTRLDCFTHHHLTRLSSREVEKLVENVSGSALPHELTAQIVAKTDGVPLFIEELTSAVLESGVVRTEDHRFVLAGALPALPVPATLQDSLTARLDRLPSARPVAQAGAALGRDFSHALIEAISDIDETTLADALAQLRTSGLLFQRGEGAERVYTFKHALIRDAAYGGLLRTQRATLHNRIAATIEAQFPAMVEAQPELLARHWTEAGRVRRAVTWWRKSGQRALSRLAFQEAITHFDQALALAPALSPDEDRDRLIADLWLECVAALRQTHWGSRRMEDAARSAFSIGVSLNDATIVGYALTAIAEVAAVRPDFAMFRDTNRNFLKLELCISQGLHTRFMVASPQEAMSPAQSIDESTRQHLRAVDQVTMADDAALTQLAADTLRRSDENGKSSSARSSTIWQFIGLELFWRGHFANLDQILKRAVECAGLDDPTYVGWHQHLLAKTWLAFSNAQLGFLDKGRELATQCIEESERVGELSHLMLALNAHNVFCFYCDDAGAISERALRLEELSFRYGVAWYQPAALLARAWAGLRIGAADSSIREAWRRGRDMLTAGIFEQIHVGVPHLLILSAHAANAMGMPEEALDDVGKALSLIERTGESHSESELHRAKGEILHGISDLDRAERCFRRALEVAQRQSARGLELRAATSLAGLLRERRRTDESRGLLNPICASFSEETDSPIVVRARTLLGEFEQTRAG